MTRSLLYRGLVFDGIGLRESSILIENGFITAIDETDRDAETVLDYTNNHNVVAFPGFIDMHVHLRDFAESWKDTVEKATSTAIIGGITLLGDMPNTTPRLNTVETIERRLMLLSEKSRTDYYVYSDLPVSRREAEDIANIKGVLGLKIYPESLGKPGVDDALRVFAAHGKIVFLHPEEPFMYNHLEKSLSNHQYGRGVLVEAEAVRHAGILSHRTRAKIHVTHASSPLTVLEAIRNGFTVDTCPHYLFFSIEKAGLKNCRAKVLPPLRWEEYRLGLLWLFQAGFIDALTTDSAPHGFTEKYCCPTTCSPGINGSFVFGPFLGHMYNMGLISLRQIYLLGAKKPAEILGLEKHYGEIKKGYRGNLTLLNLNCKWRINMRELPTASKLSIYDDMVFSSCIEATVIGGRTAYVRGEGIMDEGRGLNAGELDE